jgi:hypothetical protein
LANRLCTGSSCARCGGPHGFSDCTILPRSDQIKCPNCNGPHRSSYKGCPAYKERFNILKLKTTEGISFADAVKRYKQEQSAPPPPLNQPQRAHEQPAHTLPTKPQTDEGVINLSDPVAFPALTPPKPETKSAETQTEISVETQTVTLEIPSFHSLPTADTDLLKYTILSVVNLLAAGEKNVERQTVRAKMIGAAKASLGPILGDREPRLRTSSVNSVN